MFVFHLYPGFFKQWWEVDMDMNTYGALLLKNTFVLILWAATIKKWLWAYGILEVLHEEFSDLESIEAFAFCF